MTNDNLESVKRALSQQAYTVVREINMLRVLMEEGKLSSRHSLNNHLNNASYAIEQFQMAVRLIEPEENE